MADGPKSLPDGTQPYYLVVMDRDDWSRTVPFDADEVEADVSLVDGVQAQVVRA